MGKRSAEGAPGAEPKAKKQKKSKGSEDAKADKKAKKAAAAAAAAVATPAPEVPKKEKKAKKKKEEVAAAPAAAAPVSKADKKAAKKAKKEAAAAAAAAQATAEAAKEEKQKEKKSKKKKDKGETPAAAEPAAAPEAAEEAPQERAPQKSHGGGGGGGGDGARPERDPEEQARTMFVGGCPDSIEDKHLHAAFGEENIERIKWVERDGQFKGFGFCVFHDKASAEAALAKGAPTVDGRSLRISVGPKKDGGAGGEKRPRNDPEVAERTMFVGNCSFNIEDQNIYDEWGKDNIENIRWVAKEGQFKGFGFVVFKDLAKAKEIAAKDPPSIDGRQLRISLGPKKEGEGPPAKKQRTNEPDELKARISNCSFKIDDKDVHEHIKDVTSIKWFEREGKFSGAGLLIFATEAARDKACNDQPYTIKDRETRLNAWTSAPPTGGRGGGGQRPGGRPSMSTQSTGSKVTFD